MVIKDSGSRREFSTGAVRDDDGQKGRCDLVPLGVVGAIMSDPILVNIDIYLRTGEKCCLVDAFKEFVNRYYPDMETAILEVSLHYRDGCQKYQPRNWEKGIPLSSFIDSGTRHYLRWKRGDSDEPHNRAFLWNVLGALWTHANMPEMIDLPFANMVVLDPTEQLDGMAKTIDEEHLNKFISMWQRCHSEEV